MKLVPFVSMCVTALLMGCSDSTPPPHTVAGTPGPIGASTATPVAEPVDAAELAAQIKFPLMPNPAKAPVATKQDKGNGEMRYEIVQVVKESPKEAADFYAKKLGVTPTTKPDGFELDGQTSDGSFILMPIQTSNGKTVIAARILQMGIPNKAK